MRLHPNFWIFCLTLVFVLVVPGSALAQAVGSVAQIGVNNVAYAYQEIQNEVVILQLGDENSSILEQLGFVQLAAIAQIGDENQTRLLQDGQRDSVYLIQLGFANQAQINQVKTLAWADASSNDAFAYQSGLYNIINLLQLGADNSASLYQLDKQNEVTLIQEQLLIGTGKNGVLVMQFDIANLAHGIQLGARQQAGTFQQGNDNTAHFGQTGGGNLALLSQSGNHNAILLTQETRGLPFATKRRVQL